MGSFVAVNMKHFLTRECSYPLMLTLDATCPVSAPQEKIAVSLFKNIFKGGS